MSDKEKKPKESIELKPEDQAAIQISAATDAVLKVVTQAEEARVIAAVARLALKNSEFQMALDLLDLSISYLDTILQGYYDGVDDEELVGIVEEKLKALKEKE